MPQPAEEHLKLHRLAGRWVGEERLNASQWGPGGLATGRMTMRVDIDGLFVIQDYVEEKDAHTVYRGHGVLGWDGGKKSYAWYWVDSMGSVPHTPSLGRWEGDTLQFEDRTEAGGPRGRYTYRFTGDDSFAFRIESSRDGGRTWAQLMEATYRRVAQ